MKYHVPSMLFRLTCGCHAKIFWSLIQVFFGFCCSQTYNSTSQTSGLIFEFQIVSTEKIQTQNLAHIIDTSTIQSTDFNTSNIFNASDNSTSDNSTNSQVVVVQPTNISSLLQFYLDLLPPIQLPPPEYFNSTSSSDFSLILTTSDVVNTNLCPLDHICEQNATEPETCPLNTITLSTGTSTSCEVAPRTQICQTGFFYDRLIGNCTQDCGIGYYGNVFTLGFCMGCPMGTFSSINYAAQCSDCQNGQYSDVIAASSCLSCPFGKSTSEYSGYTTCVQVFYFLFR